jgi:TPR repeat protein
VDHETAAKWYSKGASKGNEKCMIAIGFKYISGEGVEKDIDKAMSYFKKLTKDGMGDDNAMYGMGYCYFDGLNEFGVNATVESVRCFDDAERWLLAAAQRNNVNAQFWLGQLYLQYGHIHVRVIDYDDKHKKAYEWFRKAADQGHKTAKEQLWKFRGYWPGKRI